MSAAINRRQFLRGHLSGEPAALRPPWALAEPAFLEQCQRCGDCVAACPPLIVVVGDGGFPSVDFSRGECDFCGDCVAACERDALSHDHRTTPWDYVATIADNCLARNQVVCRSCGEQCETRAIRFSPRIGGVSEPTIETERCTGCGACVAPCPVAAISVVNSFATPDNQEQQR